MSASEGRGIVVRGLVAVDADVPLGREAIIREAVALEEGLDTGALAVGLEARHVAPDLVEDDGEALPLGKGALDMAGDDVLQAAIFTQGVGFEPLQDAEQGLLLARLGLELRY